MDCTICKCLEILKAPFKLFCCNNCCKKNHWQFPSLQTYLEQCTQPSNNFFMNSLSNSRNMTPSTFFMPLPDICLANKKLRIVIGFVAKTVFFFGLTLENWLCFSCGVVQLETTDFTNCQSEFNLTQKKKSKQVLINF